MTDPSRASHASGSARPEAAAQQAPAPDDSMRADASREADSGELFLGEDDT